MTFSSKPFLPRTYVLLPLFAALIWLSGLVALLGLWARDGTPRYEPDQASIVFISSVGAVHQRLFIGMCATTAAFHLFSLLAERWLRYSNRLPGRGEESGWREVWFGFLAILFSIFGGIALILLASFNSVDFGTVHWASTVAFIVATALSALFQSLEVQALRKDFPDRPHLLRNSIMKLLILIVALAVAITFEVLYLICDGDENYGATPSEATRCNRITSACAVCEWIVGLLFSLYLFTLVLGVFSPTPCAGEEELQSGWRREPTMQEQEGLKARTEEWQRSEKFKKVLEGRMSLPAWKSKGEVLDALEKNRVLVVVGETGSGKTTQLPQFILDHEIASLRGCSTSILVTQPCRVYALGVAARGAQDVWRSPSRPSSSQVQGRGGKGDGQRVSFFRVSTLLFLLQEGWT